MQKTSNPQILNLSRRKANSSSRHSFASRYNQSPAYHARLNKPHDDKQQSLNYFKAVARKVNSLVSTILFLRRRPAGKGTRTEGGSNRDGHVKNYSFSIDASTATNNKSSTIFKSSSSYVSSSSTSTEVGEIKFSIEEIYKATENFSPANKIGQGRFGNVYKGKLKDGSIVAIKRAKKTYDRHLLAEFKNEIQTLSKIEHLNLVKFLGYLEQKDEQIIVIEYVSNGTLREHLNGSRGDLGIAERLEIAIDVAHAITYLHMYTDQPIIHRDIKAANILITEKFRAKVADFGFARLSAEDPGVTHISTRVKGSAGYLDPEYLKTYQLTEKSDVYSFGVLLVELTTGRHPIERKRGPSERITVKWVMQKLKEGDAVLVMDPRLRRSPATNQAVEKVLKLATQCIAPSRESRPSMKKCAEVLWEIRRDYREGGGLSSSSSTPHRYSKQHLDKDPKFSMKSF
ncbi:PREDICTED: calmodulin-binding receptor-like cytoplasmic kinase 2 [Nelumbo nucifera]|uniref:non-specific serine/threonine protein kinase n=2 Tax=Nelumbo nucifera TaxID=4432 RepID=A0A1U7ZT01_NELNU|nr:PREDICTED: calmodulin-binding receptor-like cytoplasmic kinase 2 [Nelumbo nucifera]DAD26625.1 TPA_asm: hypothetical protein HUJ06_028093 [Nelumbo nucifera]